ncbi:MAG: hypothetical protein R2838_17540 [Caldilineaceae bacterium]
MWWACGGVAAARWSRPSRLAVLRPDAEQPRQRHRRGLRRRDPQALRDKIDWPATYTNCLTSANFNGAKVPITLPDVRSTIVTALPSLEPADARMVIARNTLDLEELWVSQALLADVARAPQLEQIGDLRPLRFDAHGNLQL